MKITDAIILEQLAEKTNFFFFMFLGAIVILIIFTTILAINTRRKNKIISVISIIFIVISIYFSAVYFQCYTGFENENFIVTKDTLKSKNIEGNKCNIELQTSKLSKELEDLEICKDVAKGEPLIVVMVPFVKPTEEKLTLINVYSPKTNTYTGDRFITIDKIKDLY